MYILYVLLYLLNYKNNFNFEDYDSRGHLVMVVKPMFIYVHACKKKQFAKATFQDCHGTI